MQVIFAAQAYQAKSTQLLSQQCINAYTEPTPKDAKTPMPVYGTAGLSLFSRLGNGPILGMHVIGNTLYVLSGPQLFSIDGGLVISNQGIASFPATLIGTTTISNLASMDDNGSQLVMVDGNVGWIYQARGLNQVTTIGANAGATTITANVTGTITAGDTLNIPLDNGNGFVTTASSTTYGGDGKVIHLTSALPSSVTAGATIIDPSVTLGRITALAFMPADVVQFFDGYFVFNARGTRQFFISAINDGTQYSGLDFATASGGGDWVVGVVIFHEQLLLQCQDHTEVWWDSGAVAFPFQRYDAASIARGLASPLAVASEDNTVFWMGDDGIFYRLNNFNPVRVSTFAMEWVWAQYPNRYLDAQCFVLNQEGHKFIVVNFISGQQTWVYDIAAQLWHQRESWGTKWV